MKLKTVAMTGVMSLAGLGLIGVGAHAQFTTSTTSNQAFTIGTLSVSVSAPGATLTGVGSDCSNSGELCGNITLPPQGPFGSTFDTAPVLVTITNTGNVTATEITIQFTDTNDNSTLQSEVGMCLYSDGAPVFNEPLTTAEGAGPIGLVHTTIAPGATDSYSMDYYAGVASSQCGGAANAELTSGAEGGAITPAVTLSYQG